MSGVDFGNGLKNVIFIFISCSVCVRIDEEMQILSLADCFSSENGKFSLI